MVNIKEKENKTMYSLIEMLRYRRPEGGVTQMNFCLRFLTPVFGGADVHGNYILSIPKSDGQQSNLCFTAHHDTVHKEEGMQKVFVKDNIAFVDDKKSNCLGADCTTGIWIMLNMIEAKVPGVYVVHAGEESGCIGSSRLIADEPEWLKSIDAVISFDRRGDNSIVTHQMSMRTASDEFAQSFSDAVGLPQLIADSGGSFTDSNEYCGVVSECTNISVGYRGQHSTKEIQDLDFVDLLVAKLIAADWSTLVFERDCTVTEYESDWWDYGYHYGHTYTSSSSSDPNVKHISDIIEDYPDELAKLLHEYGWKADEILSEIFEMDNYNETYGGNSNEISKYIVRKGL